MRIRVHRGSPVDAILYSGMARRISNVLVIFDDAGRALSSRVEVGSFARSIDRCSYSKNAPRDRNDETVKSRAIKTGDKVRPRLPRKLTLFDKSPLYEEIMRGDDNDKLSFTTTSLIIKISHAYTLARYPSGDSRRELMRLRIP